MAIIDLCIPYERKDELKPLKIKWSSERKTWYFDGDELPEELKPYVSKFVDIAYEDKDVYKTMYKSMMFDRERKLWKMSAFDYDKMSRFHGEK